MKCWELALYLSSKHIQDFEVSLGSTGEIYEVKIDYENKIVTIR